MGDKKKTQLTDVIIGSLLHDIGKFIQRADGFNKNHSETGIQYIKDRNNDFLKSDAILDCIKFHHSKELGNSNLNTDSIAYIVYESDNIASGSERRDDSDYEMGEYKNKFLKFDKETVLKSVFNILKTKEKDKTNKGYKLRDLNELNEINFPEDINTETIKASKDKYGNLKKHLNENINNIKNPNSLLQLLESLTSFIPSSTDISQTPDISLFDHLKITAALSSCMYSYFEDNNIKNYKQYCYDEVKKYRDEQYFLLVSADISGVQDFIYTIASKGALKSLRARSFYLEIMLEHLADEILEQLNLSRANILYSGGGHFYLILPNTSETKDVLSQFQIIINEWLLNNFGISLYMALAYLECSSNQLMNPADKNGKRGNLTGEIFKELSKTLSEKKLKRYSEKQLKEIFNLNCLSNKILDGTRECTICHTSQKKLKERKIKETSLGEVCDYCFNLYKLGEKLVKEKNLFFPIINEKAKENADILLELPSLDGKKYLTLVTKNESNNISFGRIYSRNQWTIGENFSTNLWMGDYACESKDKNKTIDFVELALPNDKVGVNKLAVLRADVDNLGSIFISGFEQNEEDKKYEFVTISRYATLSRHLSLFFKHYINKICDERKLVIIYSGGDDLFIAGAWADVIAFATDLRAEFDKYTCNKLTFSAGIGFYSSSFPIYKMAELTGKLEESAKKYPDKDYPTKNAVALFGENLSIEKNNKKNEFSEFVFSWDELSEIKKIEKEIEFYCYFDEKNSSKLENKIFFSTALMYKLMNLIYNSNKKINLARLAYMLARLEPNDFKNEQLKNNYLKLKEKIYSLYKDKKGIKLLLTAINLLIYKYREAQ